MRLRITCNINAVPNTEERQSYEIDAFHLSAMINLINSLTTGEFTYTSSNYLLQKYRKETREEFLEECKKLEIPLPTAYITGRSLEDARRSMISEYSSYLNALNIVH